MIYGLAVMGRGSVQGLGLEFSCFKPWFGLLWNSGGCTRDTSSRNPCLLRVQPVPLRNAHPVPAKVVTPSASDPTAA